ncbi:hypothetical protein ACFP56_18145 [Paenibacillus septentrionalis]|uniref:Uncharacterized protein n=1 Tax=Paenibacillus septentrionalis TaxID=429342 RepID=A0ABW1VAK5_9BACL
MVLQSRLTMANDQLNFTTDWMKGNGSIPIAIARSGAVLMDGIVCLIVAMSLNKASIGSSLY